MKRKWVVWMGKPMMGGAEELIGELFRAFVKYAEGGTLRVTPNGMIWKGVAADKYWLRVKGKVVRFGVSWGSASYDEWEADFRRGVLRYVGTMPQSLQPRPLPAWAPRWLEQGA